MIWKALADFRQRVVKYEEVYEPVQADEDGGKVHYIKVIDANRQFAMQAHEGGYLHVQIGTVLQRVHLRPRYIWLALVGETENDKLCYLGGDSRLTEHGEAWGRRVADFITTRESEIKATRHARFPDEPIEKTLVLSGTLQRDTQMRYLVAEESIAGRLCRTDSEGSEGRKNVRPMVAMRRLNEMCAGDMDSLSYAQFEKRYPAEFEARQQDKLRYRFPGVGGESYQDMILRLHEVMLLLEQTTAPVVLVVNKAVLRVILAYFLGVAVDEMPYLSVPGHFHGKGGTSLKPTHVVELQRIHKGFTAEYYDV